MKTPAKDVHVTVGIIGGGVAGLALARMLELAGISYCLWEAHRDFAPAAGASLGLNPNGLRILDQLGLIDRIEEFEALHRWWEHRDGQGRLHASMTAQAQFRDRYFTFDLRFSCDGVVLTVGFVDWGTGSGSWLDRKFSRFLSMESRIRAD